MDSTAFLTGGGGQENKRCSKERWLFLIFGCGCSMASMTAKRTMPQTAPRKSGEDHPATNQPKSEWARLPASCAIASLSRSKLYANFDIAGGGIKTASIRKRGATRGVRMVNVPSLLAWLDSYAETEGEAAGGNVPATLAMNPNRDDLKP